MTVDKDFCMSSYLAFRFVVDEEKIFKSGLAHKEHQLIPEDKKRPCKTSEDIDRNIREILEQLDLSKCGVLLSGGIDSAILASYMPKGTKAYTAKCIGENAIDETIQARKYCDRYELEHVVVEVGWDDYENCMDELALFQGSPIISNEPQAYKIAKKAQNDGVECLIHGDIADSEFGGYSLMMSKDWTLEEWIDRSIYIKPETVLVNPSDIYYIYDRYGKKGEIADNEKFIKEIYSIATAGALTLACRSIGLDFIDPYEELKMSEPLDLNRVRNGDSKYLIRELFRKRYHEFEVPEKKPMSRPAEAWMRNWKGPERGEFIPGCAENMNGEKKLLLYSLERFLNLIED